MSSMKYFHVSWLTGTGQIARSWASSQPMKRLAADGAMGVVGYAGVESDDVYGDKPHPVPEWSIVVVPLLKST